LVDSVYLFCHLIGGLAKKGLAGQEGLQLNVEVDVNFISIKITLLYSLSSLAGGKK
jgi:hypothetical protein